MSRALEGIAELRKTCDTVIAIPNQKLMSIVETDTTVVEAFKMADSILHQAAKGISDLINVHGLINLYFADVETIMKKMGEAIMGTVWPKVKNGPYWPLSKQFPAPCWIMPPSVVPRASW